MAALDGRILRSGLRNEAEEFAIATTETIKALKAIDFLQREIEKRPQSRKSATLAPASASISRITSRKLHSSRTKMSFAIGSCKLGRPIRFAKSGARYGNGIHRMYRFARTPIPGRSAGESHREPGHRIQPSIVTLTNRLSIHSRCDCDDLEIRQNLFLQKLPR